MLRPISNTVDVQRFTPDARPAGTSPWHDTADHVVLIVGHLSEIALACNTGTPVVVPRSRMSR